MQLKDALEQYFKYWYWADSRREMIENIISGLKRKYRFRNDLEYTEFEEFEKDMSLLLAWETDLKNMDEELEAHQNVLNSFAEKFDCVKFLYWPEFLEDHMKPDDDKENVLNTKEIYFENGVCGIIHCY